MEDRISNEQLITSLYLEIIHGDIHIRNQYMNTLLSKISLFIRREKLEPNLPAIIKFRTALHNTIQMILQNNFPLPAYHELRDKEIKNYMDYFDNFIIKIDDAVADQKGLVEIQTLQDIETLEYCMNICYAATQDYAVSLSSKSIGGEDGSNIHGLANAMNKFSYILNLIEPILNRYNMVQFDMKTFENGAKIAMTRINQAKDAKKV